MIKVLKNTFSVIEMFTEKQFLSLGEIACNSAMQKTTVSNILKTLVDIGVLRKVKYNEYTKGIRWNHIFSAPQENDTLIEAARKITADITKKYGHGVSVLKWDGNKILRIAKSYYDDSGFVMRDEVVEHFPITNLSSLALAANLPADTRNKILSDIKLPLENVPDISTKRTLQTYLKKIKEDGLACHHNEYTGMSVFASPVFTSNNELVCIIGIFIPTARCKGKDKDIVIKQLKKAVKHMTDMIK